jgi:hypothetical protein
MPVIVTLSLNVNPTPAPDPAPDNGLEQWCKEFCPSLPIRFESVIAEWDLNAKQRAQVRDILLEHVRQATST